MKILFSLNGNFGLGYIIEVGWEYNVTPILKLLVVLLSIYFIILDFYD